MCILNKYAESPTTECRLAYMIFMFSNKIWKKRFQEISILLVRSINRELAKNRLILTVISTKQIALFFFSTFQYMLKAIKAQFFISHHLSLVSYDKNEI